jgi:hypothetical protein
MEVDALESALSLIRTLSEEIGPSRPCSVQEKEAAEYFRRWLAERGVDTALEPFQGYASFGYPYGLIFGAALTGGLLQRRGSRTGDLLAVGGVAAATLEGDLRRTPVSDLLSRRPSVNVVGRIPASGERRQTVCLCGHLDTTRSGLLFHPKVVPHLKLLLQIPALSSATLALGSLVRRLPGGRRLHVAAIAGMVFTLRSGSSARCRSTTGVREAWPALPTPRSSWTRGYSFPERPEQMQGCSGARTPPRRRAGRSFATLRAPASTAQRGRSIAREAGQGAATLAKRNTRCGRSRSLCVRSTACPASSRSPSGAVSS